MELNFRLNKEQKVVEIFIEIVTKDNNDQKLPPLKWQTIKINPVTGDYTYETTIVLYDSEKGELTLVDESKKNNCIMMDYIKALNLPIYQVKDQYEKPVNWDGPGKEVNKQFSKSTEDNTGSQM